ncbi:hypothetical protein ASPWEDRAFT_532341 [Aspergillus wentii DTO 134E9]|uniref:DUF7703 domain-containing protein n=1 Tax=Aspergillus wentii DTO 134E9 TaxID=1073089 RepID=A0A1L9RM61_ASPWE|nr:uncharacterized protein ASPWEDRAFT_532341 [Aspergillus wentii DTO 134E9]KAI9929642.1 hypothetical protein MW887_001116 [Aspergillus wentii]OJJ35908.1 hypothetical protein ASPWEDRAFT_532341 [Aspergillus wentii DTO 134E9]
MALNDVGSTLGSQLPHDITYIVTALLSVALYNVLELTFLLFLTFKRRNGLYFWSFLISSWGIAIYCIGFILKDFNLANSISYFYVTLIILGWCAMITGQSLVLYSRLHLVVRHHFLLRFVLAMIVTNVILLQIPTVILCYGANSSMSDTFSTPYSVYERIQVTIFFIQESIISAIYIYETCSFLRSEGLMDATHRVACHRLMLHLIYMNVIVVALDVTILTLEFAGRYASQTAAKGLIYSIKLKLEFNILNRLVDLVHQSNNSGSGWIEEGESCSRNLWDAQQHGTAGIDPDQHPRRLSWIIFARRVTHGSAVSTEKIMLRIIQSTKRRFSTVGDVESQGSSNSPQS